MNRNPASMPRRFWTHLLPVLVLLLALAPALSGGVANAQSAERIVFAPGASSATVHGYFVQGDGKQYVLRAFAGQLMTVSPSFVNMPYTLSIYDKDGQVVGAAAAGSQWSGTLPASGDYYLSLTTAPPAVYGRVFYSLNIAIVGPVTTTPIPAAERITFAPGATSAIVSGTLYSGTPKRYVLRALTGQTMTVEANSTAPFQIEIVTASGVLLGSGSSASPVTVHLPGNQDYYILLTLPAGGAAASYTLRVTILGGTEPGPTPVPGPAQRIVFAPGRTAATVSGAVDSGHSKAYVLRAIAGQLMTVQASGGGTFQFNIAGADGAFLGSGHENEALQVRLPESQDYYITFYVPAAAPPVTFTMTVTIVNSRPTPTPEPRVQRITFAPGAISATVRGSVDSRQPMSFVLRALTGQDMTVQTFDGGPYQVTITGEDGSYLGSANAGQTIQARLPATQDYYISFTVPAGAAGSSFTMTVTIVGSSRPTPTPLPAAQRIQFAPGATSATVGGSTPQTFVLRALASQTMVVELYTSGAPARVTVLTQGRETMGTAGENASWIGRLPATGDYYLVIEAPAGADQTGFTLRVSIY